MPQSRCSDRSFMRLVRVLLLLVMCASTLFAVAQDDDDSDPGQPIVVGYFPGWAVHKHYLVKNLISSEDTLLLDQINYSQGHVVNNECAIADPDADLNFFY